MDCSPPGSSIQGIFQARILGPPKKGGPLHDVLNVPVWLFIISPDCNDDLSLRWERIMNHLFTFKTLIKKAQVYFHALSWWLNYSKAVKTSHFEAWKWLWCKSPQWLPWAWGMRGKEQADRRRVGAEVRLQAPVLLDLAEWPQASHFTSLVLFLFAEI